MIFNKDTNNFFKKELEKKETEIKEIKNFYITIILTLISIFTSIILFLLSK